MGMGERVGEGGRGGIGRFRGIAVGGGSLAVGGGHGRATRRRRWRPSRWDGGARWAYVSDGGKPDLVVRRWRLMVADRTTGKTLTMSGGGGGIMRGGVWRHWNDEGREGVCVRNTTHKS
uniref:Uncharacterized protein n=1 Tax=Oryza sativa subsp. japonica TaxID=39947 RepID=Q5ZA76_ORYSJ|nr:hypothetical protein [Oryza sativa Japonica Group]